MSVYDQIISSNLMDIIKSNRIKEGLIEYYDYKCNRYKILDEVLDQKYHGSFMTFIADELEVGFYRHESIDPQIFIRTFDDLQNESRKVYGLTVNHHTMLKSIFTDVNNLLKLLRS